MKIIAIDPGTEESAMVIMFEDGSLRPDLVSNDHMLSFLRSWRSETVVIEKVESYGMPVGREVFDTVYWSGRFWEAANTEDVVLMPRKDVKMHLCGSMKAKDSNIRQALIDLYGGSKEKAIGRKATPGPLYGFKSHMWAALGVLETYKAKVKELEAA